MSVDRFFSYEGNSLYSMQCIADEKLLPHVRRLRLAVLFSGLHSDVEVTFPSASLATIACRTLAVDAELQPNKISRTLRVEGSSLLA